MNIPLIDLSGFMAVQHRVLKDLRKKIDLRQRDWEVLCACHRLTLGRSSITASKIDVYMQQAYFLPSLYDSISVLLDKGYISVVFASKPFRPEIYELTYQGLTLIRVYTDEMRRLYEQQDKVVVGRSCLRLW